MRSGTHIVSFAPPCDVFMGTEAMNRCKQTRKLSYIFVLALTVWWGCGQGAQAAISWGPPPAGGPDKHILFDTPNVVNPQYTFTDIPDHSSLTVGFGTHFAGQKLGSTYNSLSDASPDSTLAFAAGLPDVMTQLDLSNRNGLVLGGVNGLSRFTTPISILFSAPVSQVGFTLGYLDENPPTTVIEAYDASGASLGVLGGLPQGKSDLSIVDDGGKISGVSIYIPGNTIDQEGFGIEGVMFTAGGEVPEPTTFLVWSLLGLTAFSAAWYKSSRR